MMCEGLWLMHLLDLKIVTRALNKPAVRGTELPSIGVPLAFTPTCRTEVHHIGTHLPVDGTASTNTLADQENPSASWRVV
jgi:hypothetical protein